MQILYLIVGLFHQKSDSEANLIGWWRISSERRSGEGVERVMVRRVTPNKNRGRPCNPH